MNARQLARKARVLRWIMNLYPPYLGAGIWIRPVSYTHLTLPTTPYV